MLVATTNCVYPQNGTLHSHYFADGATRTTYGDDDVYRAAESGPVTYLRIDPVVIRKGIDLFTLELGVSDSSIIDISFDFSSRYSIEYIGGDGPSITLKDDGTRGDREANDLIFTSDSLAPVVPVYDSTHPVFDFYLFSTLIFDFHGDSEESYYHKSPISIKIIDPSVVSIPDVQMISDNAQATRRVINIVMPSVCGTYPVQYFCDPDIDPPGGAMYYEFYELFQDEYDFIISDKMIGHRNEISSTTGSFSIMNNSTTGIGRRTMTNSFGLPKNLQGIINVYASGNTFGLYNHEFLHRWAMFLDKSLDLGEVHWDAVERPSSCFGPASVRTMIEHVSDSLYLADISNDGKCSDIELYLMGLVPASDVESPIRTLVNARRPDGFGSNEFIADSVRHVGMDEIIHVSGPRVPSHASAQREFRSAYIVPYDRFLTPTELAYYDFLMAEYEKPASDIGLTFEAATGGRADLSTRLRRPVTIGARPVAADYSTTRSFWNYPNPFDEGTRLVYSIGTPGNVRLVVYDILGREVAHLVESWHSSGNHSTEFHAGKLASGTYVVRLSSEEGVESLKVVVSR